MQDGSYLSLEHKLCSIQKIKFYTWVYYVYQSIWSPVMGEQLSTEQEHAWDRCAVSVKWFVPGPIDKRRLKLILTGAWCNKRG